MNARSLELLEYEGLRALLGRYVAGDLGRRLLATLEPLADRATLERLHAETAEAIAFLQDAEKPRTTAGEVKTRPRFEGLPDVAAPAARLRIEGAVLEPLEIAALTALLERAAEVRHALNLDAARWPHLHGYAAAFADFRPVLRDVSGKILPDGTLADDASVALSRIRHDMERQRRLIQESLERFLRAHREDGLLQEDFITIRNDRFVVPLLSGAKKKVPGVIHAASGSGHTLFVEPLETIDQNNELVRLAEEELREVHRILRELTARLREHAQAIGGAAATLGALDLLFAKARFALEFDAVTPVFSPPDAPRLRLDAARHPLLEDVLRRARRRVVPITLSLDAAHNTLLISGPNTGGKTVAMKTAGLLALMAQSGLPVPAAAAEFPVFDDILADIGDNQSIEASLSTFSAHIERIREMAEAVTPESLVLLDELGRATDPEEGGALGVAILEEFRHTSAFTLASTHLLALKVYGSNAPGVLNAAMGFDEQTLAPTYLLRTGSPGKSAGLEIASRLGLPPHWIDRARAAMSTTQRDIEQFLRQLEARLGEAEQAKAEQAARLAALEAREKQLEADAERKQSARLREIEKQVAEAGARFEQQAKATIESVLASTEQRKAAERSLRQVARTKREFAASVERLKTGAPAVPAAGEIVPGARVRLRDVGQPARVLRVLPDGVLEVEVGLLKLQTPREDVVEVLPAAPAAKTLPKGVSFAPGPRWDSLAREVNVIGQNTEDALEAVDKALDSAVLAEVTRLRIVHGHGHGILRRAIDKHLARHPQVEKHYPASPQEGGTGATVVELKA